MLKNSVRNSLSEVTSLPQLVQRLQPYFLSSSLGQPPGASADATGNRTVTITNRTQGASSSTTPKLVSTQPLVGGTLTWTFSPQFNKTPVIEIAPVGAPPTSGGVPAVLYIQSVSNSTVVITSTINTDTRTLHLTATGNPN